MPFRGTRSRRRVSSSSARTSCTRGVAEVGIADTIGVATPVDVTSMCSLVAGAVPIDRLSLHVHDTRGLGVANVIAAFDAGVRRFDGSVGGVGGCPFAPRSTGNVCTRGRAPGTACARRDDRHRPGGDVRSRRGACVRPAARPARQALSRGHLEWCSSGSNRGDDRWLKSVDERLERARAGGPQRHRDKLATQHKLPPYAKGLRVCSTRHRLRRGRAARGQRGSGARGRGSRHRHRRHAWQDLRPDGERPNGESGIVGAANCREDRAYSGDGGTPADSRWCTWWIQRARASPSRLRCSRGGVTQANLPYAGSAFRPGAAGVRALRPECSRRCIHSRVLRHRDHGGGERIDVSRLPAHGRGRGGREGHSRGDGWCAHALHRERLRRCARSR